MVLISKALIESNKDDFLVNNVLREYNDMKEAIKDPMIIIRGNI